MERLRFLMPELKRLCYKKAHNKLTEWSSLVTVDRGTHQTNNILVQTQNIILIHVSLA